MFERPVDPTRFLLVGVFPKQSKKEEILVDLEETVSLVKTYGGQVYSVLVQRSDSPGRSLFVGKGKAEELGEAVTKEDIEVVLLHNSVKPRQIHAIQKYLHKVKPNTIVWDRVDLILYIFKKHAHTAEASLQIDLAAMRHMGPRIYGMGFELSRQGGGIGGVGIGETNTELMKRHWRMQMRKVQKDLGELVKERKTQIDKRKKTGVRTVSLIGYTNAGKSTLFNALTKKDKLVENALFATLDSSVGKWFIPELKQEIIVSDTIGFIKDLPPKLIDAFESTLMESVYADVLLHIIDASDPFMKEKIQVVEDILADLGLSDRKRIYIFNKIDSVSVEKHSLEETYHMFSPVFISAEKKEGLDILTTVVSSML